jgi:hypothetical protein
MPHGANRTHPPPHQDEFCALVQAGTESHLPWMRLPAGLRRLDFRNELTVRRADAGRPSVCQACRGWRGQGAYVDSAAEANDGAGSARPVGSAVSDVTRLLCLAVYARPGGRRPRTARATGREDRGGEVPVAAPPDGGASREGAEPPMVGDRAAQWVLDHTLGDRWTPVPSYGFGL